MTTNEVMVYATLIIGNEHTGYHARVTREEWEAGDGAAHYFLKREVARRLLESYFRDAVDSERPLDAVVDLLMPHVQTGVTDAPEPGKSWTQSYDVRAGDVWD